MVTDTTTQGRRIPGKAVEDGLVLLLGELVLALVAEQVFGQPVGVTHVASRSIEAL